MTERNIDTGIWGDAWFQELDPSRKLLFIYLWTNPSCSSAGMYPISIRTIAFDTGLDLAQLPSLLTGLAPKVAWYQDCSLVWVRNFLRRQSRSPKFLTAVAKSLRHLPPDRVSEFLAYNSNVSIPYAYPIDRVSIPSAQDQTSLKPKDQPKDQTSLKPETSSPTPSPAAATEKTNVQKMHSTKPKGPRTFEELDLTEFKARFPGVDITWELAKCVEWWTSKGKTVKSPRLAFSNWCENAKQRKEGRNGYGEQPNPNGSRPRQPTTSGQQGAAATPSGASPFAKYAGDSGEDS